MEPWRDRAHEGIGSRAAGKLHGSLLGAVSAERLRPLPTICETGQVRTPDFVDVVEAAYVASSPRRWLEQVTTALGPLLDRGAGLLCYGFDARDARAIELDAPLFAGAGPEVWRAMQASTEGLEPRAVQRTYLGSRPFGTVAQRFVGSTRGIFSELARRNYAPNGFADLLVLHVIDTDRRGCLFAAPLGRSRDASRKEITLWSRVAAHLRAGYRASRRYAEDSEDGEAILEPGGRVLHAHSSAASLSARESLRHAALDTERTRSARRRSDAQSALELWPALIAGRWTLIERFDTDGRRLLIARRNEPDVQQHVQLTARERDVLQRALNGDSNKLIAHELIVSEATISEHLKSGLSKLNLRSLDEARELAILEAGRHS